MILREWYHTTRSTNDDWWGNAFEPTTWRLKWAGQGSKEPQLLMEGRMQWHLCQCEYWRLYRIVWGGGVEQTSVWNGNKVSHVLLARLVYDIKWNKQGWRWSWSVKQIIFICWESNYDWKKKESGMIAIVCF